ncbi:SRPBCC family protein [Haloterrigena alkaliphila]|uniref:SRPBCC family protein n=1 Tax=Haloterrigena alkaliphila TaxID=2816475 RepID=A0A8A2VCS9_9EURY|nr:SRPBCC family protein [Haloterrigena alkaliphila]QSW98520.1 SRPBCC family protein [Haloterrigena alkaliphila]
MPTYERRTTVDAPLEEVWEFHSRVEGLEAVTPDWMGLRVEAVLGPDGRPDPDVLEVGTELALSIRPLGIGPRQHWTSLITDRDRRDDGAYFRDEMVYGPFERWEHTHAFSADGERTVLRDRVVYELPVLGRGPLAEVTTPFSQAGFEAMFRGRHRATKARLE